VENRTILDFVPLDNRHLPEVIGEDTRGDKARNAPADDNRVSDLIHKLTGAAVRQLFLHNQSPRRIVINQGRAGSQAFRKT
jgi:hypothetical protein